MWLQQPDCCVFLLARLVILLQQSSLMAPVIAYTTRTVLLPICTKVSPVSHGWCQVPLLLQLSFCLIGWNATEWRDRENTFYCPFVPGKLRHSKKCTVCHYKSFLSSKMGFSVTTGIFCPASQVSVAVALHQAQPPLIPRAMLCVPSHSHLLHITTRSTHRIPSEHWRLTDWKYLALIFSGLSHGENILRSGKQMFPGCPLCSCPDEVQGGMRGECTVFPLWAVPVVTVTGGVLAPAPPTFMHCSTSRQR